MGREGKSLGRPALLNTHIYCSPTLVTAQNAHLDAFPKEEDKDGTNQSSVFFVYFFCCSCNFVKLFTEVVLIKVLLHQ